MFKKASLSFAVVAATLVTGSLNTVQATENEPVGVSVKSLFVTPMSDSGKTLDKDNKTQFTYNLGGAVDYKIGNFSMDQNSEGNMYYGVELGGYTNNGWNAFAGVTGGVRMDAFYAQVTLGGQYGNADDLNKATTAYKTGNKSGFMVKPTLGIDVFKLGETPLFVEGTMVYNFNADLNKSLDQYGLSVGVRF